MERRDFLMKSGILSAFGIVGQTAFTASPAADGDKLSPVLLPPLAPLAHDNGMTVRVWIRSAMTNGVYSNIECACAPKLMGPPPHYHKELDELMYVLEGTASILIGDDIVQVEAGGWHLRPRMIKHTFWNASDKPLRFMDMYFNQPFEEYLERIFHELTVENGYVDGSEEKNREINLLNEKFGLIFPDGAFDQRNEIATKFNLK
ncbi:MAG: cupin domain-containing protein [Bacteroidetes bacterium]|nr:cupin domain-containing protein [Bacteroidota bacterium]